MTLTFPRKCRRCRDGQYIEQPISMDNILIFWVIAMIYQYQNIPHLININNMLISIHCPPLDIEDISTYINKDIVSVYIHFLFIFFWCFMVCDILIFWVLWWIYWSWNIVHSINIKDISILKYRHSQHSPLKKIYPYILKKLLWVGFKRIFKNVVLGGICSHDLRPWRI